MKLTELVEKLRKDIQCRLKPIYWYLGKNDSNQQERIFVAGMQRSGTNMLMDILEESFETDVYHERDPRAFDNYQMRDRATIQTLIDSSRAPKFVIKALCELQDLGQLMQDYQPAKVVWIVRQYDDVVTSMLKSFGNMEKQVIRIVHQNSDEWLGRGMSENTKNTLKDLVYSGMGDASASALQWYFRNILFFEQRFENDKGVLLISYEKLVTEPAAQVQKICDFIGIKYSPRMIKNIFASSINRRAESDINPEICAICDSLQSDFEKLIK